MDSARRPLASGRFGGRPPRDHSRRFAIVAITLTVGGWVILPIAVALAFTS